MTCGTLLTCIWSTGRVASEAGSIARNPTSLPDMLLWGLHRLTASPKVDCSNTVEQEQHCHSLTAGPNKLRLQGVWQEKTERNWSVVGVEAPSRLVRYVA
eukprot:4729927-Amphidinium_carterae.4